MRKKQLVRRAVIVGKRYLTQVLRKRNTPLAAVETGNECQRQQRKRGCLSSHQSIFNPFPIHQSRVHDQTIVSVLPFGYY